MNTAAPTTVFGSLKDYRKGSIEITQGSPRHYVFSNIFEVASNAAPYEKTVVGKNLEYVIETLRAEGVSPWYVCSHDEFAILMDGQAQVDFLALDQPPAAADGTVLAGQAPAGSARAETLRQNGLSCSRARPVTARSISSPSTASRSA